MILVNSSALIWAIVAVPVVVLYIVVKTLPRRHAIQTGFLWQRVFLSEPARSAWWRWRTPISLCVQLTVLASIVLAMAEPHLQRPRSIVVILDNSASMNAVDVAPSRLERARQLARGLVTKMSYRDRMAILAAGEGLVTACGLTSDRGLLERAIAGVVPTGGPTRVQEAVGLARRMLADQPYGEILVVSDGCFQGAAELAVSHGVRFLPVGTHGDNMAIAGLAVRRALGDPDRCQVFARLRSYAAQTVSCRVAFELDGRLLSAVPIEMAPEANWSEVYEFSTSDGGDLVARIDRADDFPADNQASVRLGPGGIHQVTLVPGGNLFLEKSLAANPLVELTVSTEPPTELGAADVMVFSGLVPTRLPEGPLLVVDPQTGCDLWGVKDTVPGARIIRQADGSPLLEDVRLEGVDIGEARVLDLTAAAASMATALAWTGEAVPVVYAIDRPAGRVIVLSFSTELSELPQQTAWPILVANALEWLADEAGSGSHRASRAGETAGPALGEPGPTITGQAESDIRVPAGLVQSADAGDGDGPWTPLWVYAAAVALAITAAEWCLFQRRWTC